MMAAALGHVLDDLAHVLLRVSDEDYQQKPVGVIPGSIGGHVRHCLDHVVAVLDAAATGLIDYDHRRRGTNIEFERRVAIDALHDAVQRLRDLPENVADQTLTLICMTSPAAPAVEVLTSVGRELAYVLSHTIHHNAIVGAMIRTLGGDVPDTFGFAPSTIAHQRRQEALCAR